MSRSIAALIILVLLSSCSKPQSSSVFIPSPPYFTKSEVAELTSCKMSPELEKKLKQRESFIRKMDYSRSTRYERGLDRIRAKASSAFNWLSGQ